MADTTSTSTITTTLEASSLEELADYIDEVFGEHEKRQRDNDRLGVYRRQKHGYAAGQIKTITDLIRRTTIVPEETS
jgi:hypothetical protein